MFTGIRNMGPWGLSKCPLEMGSGIHRSLSSPQSGTRSWHFLRFFSASDVRVGVRKPEDGVDEATLLKRAKNREWYNRKKAEDPNFLPRRAELFKVRRHRAMEDPAQHREFLERRRATNEKNKEWQREYDSQIKHARPASWVANIFRKWLFNVAWVRESTWRTHEPIFYERRTARPCASCGRHAINGSFLFWRRRGEPDLYDCQTCFVKNFQYMPIGYEDYQLGTGKIRKLRIVSEETIAKALAEHQHTAMDGKDGGNSGAKS